MRATPMVERAQGWFLGLGRDYGVDPLIFGSIYVGAIPLFTLSLAWLVRRLRARRPIVAPLLASGLFFVSAYLYLAIAGRNLPSWVYVMIAALLALGGWSAVRGVRRKTRGGAE